MERLGSVLERLGRALGQFLQAKPKKHYFSLWFSEIFRAWRLGLAAGRSSLQNLTFLFDFHIFRARSLGQAKEKHALLRAKNLPKNPPPEMRAALVSVKEGAWNHWWYFVHKSQISGPSGA